MGIKHFFLWFKQTFPDHIKYFKKENAPDMGIDTFMVDMNGVFHSSAQHVFKYGNGAVKTHKSFLRRPQQAQTVQLSEAVAQQQVFQHICESVDNYVNIVKPRKRIVLCVDGTAPLGKQNQQRQRRFRGAMETPDSVFNIFDANSITPGTKFMDNLTSYVDYYIKKKVNEGSSRWSKLEVIFSSEKVPGEGEHKLINYIRRYGEEDETFCINALDADLFMLTLGTFKPNIYLLRDNVSQYETTYSHLFVDIGAARETLVNKVLRWSDGDEYNVRDAVRDFILICFMCGNDFLPNIPSIEIMENGLVTIIEVYKSVGKEFGHLTMDKDSDIDIKHDTLRALFGTIAQYEQDLLEAKYNRRSSFMPDEIMEKCKLVTDGDIKINIEDYRRLYYETKLNADLEAVSSKYVEGMTWVLNYYTKGIKSWDWLYPYNYSPFCYDLAKHFPIKKFTFETTDPFPPFMQLLCVLPPRSHTLIPSPLNTLILKSSPLAQYYPETFKIDYAGKAKQWEGVIVLPCVNVEEVRKLYDLNVKRCAAADLKRNRVGTSFKYENGKRTQIIAL